MRSLLIAGAVAAAAGVMLGAFGAHALKDRLDAGMLAVWQTAVHYHLVHALGMVAIGFAALHWQQASLALAGWLLAAGIVLFSGSLYLLALTELRWLGAVTPLGGLAFIAGWLGLAWAASRLPSGG
ncbi:MAG TPA: DUF423 domain-containing protein [Gammaproteobacteria bacterium]|jgi:uncharacterized membrane protein YgdD (TMEM256/DUF423 family)